MFSTNFFLNKISKLADEFDMFLGGGIVLVGVSGGADSMCLLDALIDISAMRGFTVAAAHFNHKLRGDESDLDEAFVARECKKRDIELIVDSADVMSYALENGMGKVEAARELRYAFFEKASDKLSAAHGLRTVRIATAHNADDLAETVIINLARGAGMSGLSGIPPRRGAIIRPMLHITRNEIIEYINAKGIEYVEDSSNSLQNQVRNKIRHTIIPVLREINPRFTEATVRAAQLVGRDEDYLSSLADEYAADAGFLSIKAIAALPYPIKSRVIRQMGSKRLSYEHINAILELCETGKPSARLSLPEMVVRREYDKVYFEKNIDFSRKKDIKGEAKQGFGPMPLYAGLELFIPEAKLKVLCSQVEYNGICNDAENQAGHIFSKKATGIKTFSTFLFHIDGICGTMSVGSRREGDSLRLFGSNHTKSLKKLFIDNRIPAAKRGLVPIIFDEQGVLAVYGICRSNRAIPESGAKALKVEFVNS